MPAGKFLIPFFLINLIVSLYYLDQSANPNSTSRVLAVASLSENRSLNIDQNKDQTIDKAYVLEHYYPLQPPFPSWLVWPVFEVLKSAGIAKPYQEDQGKSIFLLGSFLIGSLPFSLLILLIYIRLIHQGLSHFEAVVLSTIPLYASMFFVYSGVFYSHVFVAALIAFAYHLISEKRHFLLAGVLSGMAFFSEYLTAVIFAVWFFQLSAQHLKKAFLYGLGLFPFVLGFLSYNYVTTGNAFHTVYSHSIEYPMEHVGFSYPHLDRLFQMLFTLRKGAFVFVPVLISIFFSLRWKPSISVKEMLQHKIWLPVILFAVALASYKEWAGGWTFGPRYLIPAITLILIGFINRISLKGKKKWLFWIPVSLGVCYTFLAKISVGFTIPSKYSYPFLQYIVPNLKIGNFNNSGVLNFLFDVPPWADALGFSILMCILALLVRFSKNSTIESRFS